MGNCGKFQGTLASFQNPSTITTFPILSKQFPFFIINTTSSIDLKPENILLSEENEIKVIDFGTAKDLDQPEIKGSGMDSKGKSQ